MLVYNPTSSPVVVDDRGRTVAGRERLVVADNAIVHDAVTAGLLVVVDEAEQPGAGESPDPQSDKTSGRRRRSERE